MTLPIDWHIEPNEKVLQMFSIAAYDGWMDEWMDGIGF